MASNLTADENNLMVYGLLTLENSPVIKNRELTNIISYKGNWISSNYKTDDIVSYNDNYYICILNTVSNENPNNLTYWKVFSTQKVYNCYFSCSFAYFRYYYAYATKSATSLVIFPFLGTTAVGRPTKIVLVVGTEADGNEGEYNLFDSTNSKSITSGSFVVESEKITKTIINADLTNLPEESSEFELIMKLSSGKGNIKVYSFLML